MQKLHVIFNKAVELFTGKSFNLQGMKRVKNDKAEVKYNHNMAGVVSRDKTCASWSISGGVATSCMAV